MIGVSSDEPALPTTTEPCLDVVDDEPVLYLLVPDPPGVGSRGEGVHGADDKAIPLLAGKLLERREMVMQVHISTTEYRSQWVVLEAPALLVCSHCLVLTSSV